jgi:hypothetical protein
MDLLAGKLKNDSKRLEKVSKNIQNTLSKLDNKKILSSQEKLVYNILKYLDARIEFIKLDNIQQLQNIEDNAFDKILESVQNPDISESDKKALENAIITIQTNLLEKSQQNINNLM